MTKEENVTLVNQAVKGSLFNFMAAILTRVGTLIFTIIIARILLPESFGIYNLALSVAMLFLMFGKMGIDETFIRYFAESARDKVKATMFFRYLIKIKLFLLFGLTILLLFAAYPLSLFLFKKSELLLPLILAGAFTFLVLVESFFASFFIAVKKVQFLMYKDTLYQLLRIGLVVGLTVVMISKPSVLQIFAVLIAAAFFTLMYSLYYVHHFAPHLFSKGEVIEPKDKKRIFNFFKYSTITSISMIFFGSIDTIMLGSLVSDASAVGLYSAAFAISSSVAGLLGFGMVLLPIFVEVSKNKLETAFNHVLRYSMILAIPATVGLALLGNYFIVLIYGRPYINAQVPLFILSIMIILTVYVSLIVRVFLARERPQDYLNLLVTTVVINIVLNYVLIVWFAQYSITGAITGAAIATIGSWILYAVGMGIMAKNKLAISTSQAAFMKPLIASTIMGISVYYLKNAFVDINAVNGVLLVVSGMIVYAAIMLLIKGITRQDILLLRKIAFKKARK